MNDAARPSPSDPGPPGDSRAGVARWLLLGLGWACVALGALGAFLPVLPTTPFLLLASACFARSSPAIQRRLLANRVFGPYLRQWQHDRTVPRVAKRKAYGLIVLAFALSIWGLEARGPRWILAGLGTALIAFLMWLPTTPEAPRDEPPAS